MIKYSMKIKRKQVVLYRADLAEGRRLVGAKLPSVSLRYRDHECGLVSNQKLRKEKTILAK